MSHLLDFSHLIKKKKKPFVGWPQAKSKAATAVYLQAPFPKAKVSCLHSHISILERPRLDHDIKF
jgi:hypothetical protein